MTQCQHQYQTYSGYQNVDYSMDDMKMSTQVDEQHNVLLCIYCKKEIGFLKLHNGLSQLNQLTQAVYNVL